MVFAKDDSGPNVIQQYGYVIFPVLGVIGGLVLVIGGYAIWRGPHRPFLPDAIRKKLQRNVLDGDDDEEIGGKRKPRVPVPDRFLGKEKDRKEQSRRDPNAPTRADIFKAEVIRARESGSWGNAEDALEKLNGTHNQQGGHARGMGPGPGSGREQAQGFAPGGHGQMYGHAHQMPYGSGPAQGSLPIRLPPAPQPVASGPPPPGMNVPPPMAPNHAGRGVPAYPSPLAAQSITPPKPPIGGRRQSSGNSDRLEWMQAPSVDSIDEAAEMEHMGDAYDVYGNTDRRVSTSSDGSAYSLSNLPRRTSSFSGTAPSQRARVTHAIEARDAQMYSSRSDASTRGLMTSPIATSPSVTIPPVAARPPRRSSVSSTASPMITTPTSSINRGVVPSPGYPSQASLGYGRPPMIHRGAASYESDAQSYTSYQSDKW